MSINILKPEKLKFKKLKFKNKKQKNELNKITNGNPEIQKNENF